MKSHHLLNLLLICFPLVALPLSALAADAPAKEEKGNAASASAVAAPTGGKVEAAPSPAVAYKLRPGDWIKATVLDDPRANHDYKIAPDGTVLPLFLDQPINLAGLTVAAAGQALEKAYGDGQIFVRPKAAIALNQALSPESHIKVVGLVVNPHEVVIPPGEVATLLSVITACGGPTQIAAPEVSIIRKSADGKTMNFMADLRAAVRDATKDISLKDGDTVYVPQDSFGGYY